MPKFTNLQLVNLNEIWSNEAQDFTPWLAKEENMSRLADALNMDLKFEAREKQVGQFQADILCRNLGDETRVVIENQLKKTDHKHLGQVLTYATGLKATTIVWIASEFTDEHREALDLLNEITDDRYQFFGVEIKVWKIVNSPYALEFNVVSNPQSWNRPVIDDNDDDWRTRFWSKFKEHLLSVNSKFKIRVPSERTSVDFGIGSLEFSLRVTLSPQKERIGVRLNMIGPNATAHFKLLEEDREAIEAALRKQLKDEDLDWKELQGKKSCQIVLLKKDTNPSTEADWQKQHEWLVSKLNLFNDVFRTRINGLNAAEWQSRDDADSEDE